MCDMNMPHHLVLETQTFDSFLCAFLEFFWSTGIELEISPGYRFLDPDRSSELNPGAGDQSERSLRYRDQLRRNLRYRDKSLRNVRYRRRVGENLFRSLHLLCVMFERRIIEENSTVHVEDFAKRFPPTQDGPRKERADWLFARHWYSTLVDNLTARHKETKQYLWQPESLKIKIMPLPYHLGSAIEQGKERLDPVACWGEWHLAVLAGSENEALAVELVNNLMSSRRICERASSCAALPTVEEFYTRYGDEPCLRLPERSDIKLPQTTYNEMRKNIFRHAKSRNQIFDYHHCMRELHAVLSRIQKSPSEAKEKLGELVKEAMKRIERHQFHEMMLH